MANGRGEGTVKRIGLEIAHQVRRQFRGFGREIPRQLGGFGCEVMRQIVGGPGRQKSHKRG